MSLPSSVRALLALLVMTCLVSVVSAQSTCGVPGAPVCTSTPRPTRQPTQAPTSVPEQQQPTAVPTSAPTDAPLIPMAATGACVAAPNGNIRVNVRDIPSMDGEIVAVLASTDVVQVLGVFVNDGGEEWILTLPGYILRAALRFGGENCAATLAEPLSKDTPVVVRLDLALLQQTNPVIGVFGTIIGRPLPEDSTVSGIIALPEGDGATSDDVCIEYPYRDPYGGGGTICLPFDIPSTIAYCSGGYCILVDPYDEEFEPDPLPLSAALVPPGETPLPDFPLILKAIDDIPTNGKIYHTDGNEGDVCIEYSLFNPYGGKTSLCLAADLGSGDVVCYKKHCMVVE